jgi:hypothetical protein
MRRGRETSDFEYKHKLYRRCKWGFELAALEKLSAYTFLLIIPVSRLDNTQKFAAEHLGNEGGVRACRNQKRSFDAISSSFQHIQDLPSLDTVQVC